MASLISKGCEFHLGCALLRICCEPPTKANDPSVRNVALSKTIKGLAYKEKDIKIYFKYYRKSLQVS